MGTASSEEDTSFWPGLIASSVYAARDQMTKASGKSHRDCFLLVALAGEGAGHSFTPVSTKQKMESLPLTALIDSIEMAKIVWPRIQ